MNKAERKRANRQKNYKLNEEGKVNSKYAKKKVSAAAERLRERNEKRSNDNE